MNASMKNCCWYLRKFTFALIVLVSFSVNADLGDTPIIGGIFNASEIMRDEIVSSMNFSSKLTRDVTFFTIGGVSLDAYILTLPLESSVKKRVIAQLSNPSYSIPLGYFLHSYYDRYNNLTSDDEFKSYLAKVYDEETLKGFEHSLYKQSVSVLKQQEGDGRQGNSEGIKADRHFIASMVTIYDALVDIGQWRKMDSLPDKYTYLRKTPEDFALVDKIQPIVINIVSQSLENMDEGDMKSMLLAIVEDGKTEFKSKINNKAQALTITLIDFVRLNVLKAYRQFVFKQQREEALNKWMQNTFDEDSSLLITFLESQQERRYAVQIAVDGLQQGLVEGLVDPKKTFIKQAYIDDKKNTQKNKSTQNSLTSKFIQQTEFMTLLANNTYDDVSYLPFFKKLYKNYRRSITQVGISSTPTISVRNLPIIKTGAQVSGASGTGVPNFHFIDRKEDRAYYFFGNDALQLDRLLDKNGVKTMFDRLVHLNTLNCNAQYDWNAHTTYDGLVNLGFGEVQRDYGEKRCINELNNRAEAEIKLRTDRSELIDDIKSYQQMSYFDLFTKLTKKWKIENAIKALAKHDGLGMPDFTMIYNPWPDHFAHFAGPFSDEIIMPTGELNRLDYWLNATEKAYQRAGIYDKTLWGMAGDHGLAPVYSSLNPEKVIFEELTKSLGYPILVKKISSDEGEGPKITNALNHASNHNIDVVVASTAGGNMMFDFFNAELGWQVQPIYNELIHWKPINAKVGSEIDIVGETAERLSDSLDYMVVRERQCSLEQCKVRLIGYRGGKRVDETVERVGNKLFYANLQNNNLALLGVGSVNKYRGKPSKNILENHQRLIDKCIVKAKESDKNSWCDEQQWRELTMVTSRPDSVNQIVNIYKEALAGTINLFPKSGIGFNTKVPGRHAGESYFEKDAFIGFWGEPIGDNVIPLNIEQNGSLAPTLYEYLTGDSVTVGVNGWGYSSLINKLDIMQQSQ